jgi:hypothetical protein
MLQAPYINKANISLLQALGTNASAIRSPALGQVPHMHVRKHSVPLQHAQRKQQLLLGRPGSLQLEAQQAQAQALLGNREWWWRADGSRAANITARNYKRMSCFVKVHEWLD